MERNILFIFFTCVVLFFSCDYIKDPKEKYYIRETSGQLKFNLDANTTLLIKSMFPFFDDKENDYLVFQNDKKPELLIYNIKTEKLFKKITFDQVGPNSVGHILGFYVKSFDEIYLCRMDVKELVVTNIQGDILRRINYSKSTDGMELTPTQTHSFLYLPIVFVHEKIYITQYPNPIYGEKIIEQSPLSVVIDTTNNLISKLPIGYPSIIKSEDYRKKGNIDFSRDFDGRNFVYSFCLDEDIYIASENHKSIQKIKAKSQYINSLDINKNPEKMNEFFRVLCEQASYGNIIYDKYRNIYYRIAYPETQIDKNENFVDIWQFGRKVFSIIILDKDFNIVGETLFPEYTYISTLMFVREDGLYISDSHYKNPSFNEDVLSFRRFELVKK